MKLSIILGGLLILLGVFALVGKNITYTEKEKIIDIGPIEAKVEKRKNIPVLPILGGVAIAGGAALLLVGARNKK